MFSDIGAGFKSMVGGEIKAMTKLTKDLRNELVTISLTSSLSSENLDHFTQGQINHKAGYLKIMPTG